MSFQQDTELHYCPTFGVIKSIKPLLGLSLKAICKFFDLKFKYCRPNPILYEFRENCFFSIDRFFAKV